MKIKRLFAAVSVCAAMVLTPLAAVFSGNAAEPVSSQAFLCGQIGSKAVWSADSVTDGSKIAPITGDERYEVTWKVDDIGTDSLTFLALSIPGVTSDKYRDINVKVTDVIIDGEKVDYTMSANALNTAYYEAGRDPEARVYLYDSLKGTNVQDLPKNTEIKDYITVIFTLSGTGSYGTSNVETKTDTTTATDETEETTTTVDDLFSVIASTTTAEDKSDNIDSTTTGDGGVAALAIAGLVITGGAAVLSKIKVRSKK